MAVLDGLEGADKSIPCRFLYDARGSELFEQITRLEEYYPTRTETTLLRAHGAEVAELAGQGCAVVEFGSGSSRKTHVLLAHMKAAAAYVPIDIDREALQQATARLNEQFPDLSVYPVHADFSQAFSLPDEIGNAPRVGFFPGSTIGNFEKDDAVEFLVRAGHLLGAGSALLIGVDLKKDLEILLPAYDDAKGITAQFSLNLLHRINRELEGSFEVEQFSHVALYNSRLGRIEIYIESRTAQKAAVLGRVFSFAPGERIHVENSHKYTLAQFGVLAASAGWDTQQTWTDTADLFSLHYLKRI